MSDNHIARDDGEIRPISLARLTKPLIPITTLDELLAKPRPDWFISGVAHSGDLINIFAAPSAGKTLVAVRLAVCVASKDQWLGRDVQHGRVVYITAEGRSCLGERLRAACRGLPRGRESVIANIDFILMPLDFLEPDTVNSLIEAIKASGPLPALIVIDPLARFMGSGDENSAQDMGRLVSACDMLRVALNTTVVIVHHSGTNKDRPRGSTALNAAVDVELKVDSKDGLIVIKGTKGKDAPLMPPTQARIVVERLDDGSPRADPRQSVRIEHVVADTSNGDAEATRRVLKALAELGSPARVPAVAEQAQISEPHASRILKREFERGASVRRDKLGKAFLYSLIQTSTAPSDVASHHPKPANKKEKISNGPDRRASHHPPSLKEGGEENRQGEIQADTAQEQDLPRKRTRAASKSAVSHKRGGAA